MLNVRETLDYFNYCAIDILARMGNFTPQETQIEQVATYLRVRYDSNNWMDRTCIQVYEIEK